MTGRSGDGPRAVEPPDGARPDPELSDVARSCAALPAVVLFDGRLVPPDEAVISAFDRAVLYGESLFETMKVVEGRPCLWVPHVERLAAGCAELGVPLDMETLEEGVRLLLAARPVEYGVLRVQITGGGQPGGGRGLTAPAAGRRPHVVASVNLVAPIPAHVYERGVAVITATDLHRPLPWLKSGSYLASVAAKGRAEARSAFECLFLEGDPPHLVEGSFTSLFLIEDHASLVVPPRDDRLPGITLGVVVEEASRLGITVREEAILPASVERGCLCLASSLLGLCRCSSVDGVTTPPEALQAAAGPADALSQGLDVRECLSREEARWVSETSTM